MEKIAVFPIPNCVAFPGNSMPLHVFEPRYRQMVSYCLEQQMPIGVCHVEKVLHQSKPEQTIVEALHSNQATYKPVSILTAGPVEVVETLADGRLLIEIQHKQRYRLLDNVQTLPFFIYTAEPYDDLPESDAQQALAEQVKDKVLHRLQALAAEVPELRHLLTSPEWQSKTPAQLSYELFQFVQLDGEVMQTILEKQTAAERLTVLLGVLNNISTMR